MDKEAVLPRTRICVTKKITHILFRIVFQLKLIIIRLDIGAVDKSAPKISLFLLRNQVGRIPIIDVEPIMH